MHSVTEQRSLFKVFLIVGKQSQLSWAAIETCGWQLMWLVTAGRLCGGLVQGMEGQLGHAIAEGPRKWDALTVEQLWDQVQGFWIPVAG